MLLNIVRCSVYGVIQHYCEDSEAGQHIATLTGQRTLQERHLTALTALGFTLVIGDSAERPEWVRAVWGGYSHRDRRRF